MKRVRDEFVCRRQREWNQKKVTKKKKKKKKEGMLGVGRG